ncbi:hypothetical protein GCM10025794_33860 [Massilia kyonggiensis]
MRNMQMFYKNGYGFDGARVVSGFTKDLGLEKMRSNADGDKVRDRIVCGG